MKEFYYIVGEKFHRDGKQNDTEKFADEIDAACAEQIFDKRLSGTWERIVGNDFTAPVVVNFQPEFTTLEIVSDDQTIPIIGSYSSVANINVSYNEQSHLYNLTIIIV